MHFSLYITFFVVYYFLNFYCRYNEFIFPLKHHWTRFFSSSRKER